MKYILEYENGLQRIVYAKGKLQDVKFKIPQEGLRSIACVNRM